MMKIVWKASVVKNAAVWAGILFLAAACAKTGTSGRDAAADAPKQNLKAAPLVAVTDIAGREFSLEKNVAAGRPTVVYFMASWCPICASNWEGLNTVVPKYEGKVDFIAVSIDPTDTADVLQKLAADKGLKFRTSPGNPEVVRLFGVTEQTAKFAIDKEGHIVAQHDGALTAQEWDTFFAQLISG